MPSIPRIMCYCLKKRWEGYLKAFSIPEISLTLFPFISVRLRRVLPNFKMTSLDFLPRKAYPEEGVQGESPPLPI